MIQKEVDEEGRRIKRAYEEYLQKLSVLEKERFDIVSNFIKKLEERRTEDVRKSL